MVMMPKRESRTAGLRRDQRYTSCCGDAFSCDMGLSRWKEYIR